MTKAGFFVFFNNISPRHPPIARRKPQKMQEKTKLQTWSIKRQGVTMPEPLRMAKIFGGFENFLFLGSRSAVFRLDLQP
jgi:hypothetical protein